MEKLNYETIKHYQSFASIGEIDLAVRGFLDKFKSSLSGESSRCSISCEDIQ
ncbi:hypothetical protein R4Z10_08290 [Niallia sp. XMNu-256]|uniref:hypothetical protein n=1 Tax=Niallia sp. XMNu-256 TaxID=3082444 RepID=UPI0030CB0C61